MSSFVETVATSLLKEAPVEFVKYPLALTISVKMFFYRYFLEE